MRYRNIKILLILLAAVAFSCKNKNANFTKQLNIQSKQFQDQLVDANKMYVKRENDEINQYVIHKGWAMTTTGTGLRYMILKEGKGMLAKSDSNHTMIVKVKFKKSLLDGTLCYSSDSTGAEQFVIGQDNVESGLHEGVQYMHVGDKAVMILPSHLAFGLLGDGDKIPPRASVLYELELESVTIK